MSTFFFFVEQIHSSCSNSGCNLTLAEYKHIMEKTKSARWEDQETLQLPKWRSVQSHVEVMCPGTFAPCFRKLLLFFFFNSSSLCSFLLATGFINFFFFFFPAVTNGLLVSLIEHTLLASLVWFKVCCSSGFFCQLLLQESLHVPGCIAGTVRLGLCWWSCRFSTASRPEGRERK